MTIKSEVIEYLNKTSRGNLPKAVTIQNGREGPAPAVWFEGGFSRKSMGDVVAKTDNGHSILTRYNLEKYLEAFESPFKTAHRNVIENTDWLAFYNASPHPVAWDCKGQDGSTAPFHFIKSIPCWACGIVLPLTAIQVDHSRPQAANPYESVAKVFRHCGLTLGAPKGLKGRTKLGAAGAPLAPAPSTPNERYTLNVMGRFMYQIIVAAEQRQSLVENSRNSFANLRPLCAQCNTARNAQAANKF